MWNKLSADVLVDPNIFTFLPMNVTDYTIKLGSTTHLQYFRFVVPADNVWGVVDRVTIDDHNIRVRIVASVLKLCMFLCQILNFVFGVLYLSSKYLYFGICQTLTFFTPDGKWWPRYLYHLDLLIINCCFNLHRTVTEKCQRVKASILQNLFRHIDFLAVQTSVCKVRRFTAFFIIASCLSQVLVSTHVCSVAVVTDTDRFQSDDLSWKHIGGGRIPLFNLDELLPHVDCAGKIVTPSSSLRFAGHKHKNVAEALYSALGDHVYGKVPLDQFVAKLTLKDAKSVAKIHKVHVPSRFRAENIAVEFKGHLCSCCDDYVSVFTLHSVKTNSENSKQWYASLDASQKQERQKNNEASIEQKQKKAEHMKLKREADRLKLPDFPPPPPSNRLQETVAINWCEDTSPSRFMEGGCAVCGQLIPLTQLFDLYGSGCDLELLVREGMGITRLERFSSSDPVLEVKGPILDQKCTKICSSCKSSLDEGLTPKYALANGLWLGEVPSELKDLSYAEQLLVSRVRRNKCIVQVSSGMHKMKTNVIAFENPMPKIYARLPPPLEDLDEVLAFIYTGPCRPSPEDLERTPLLVRRKKVSEALEWLKLNHVDYCDMDIAYDNLVKYPENEPPVLITYRNAFSNKNPESVSAFDNELEEGVDSGPCPFVVNGITGENLNTMGPKALAAKAIKHLKEDDGKVLAIGHAEKPESIYDNPQLYPMMFPWLFPYGLGGIGTVNSDTDMSEMMHKRKLLMYHDKRFQKDAHFPLIAFNQEQIKGSTTGGYLMTERQNFDDIAERLMNIDVGVLENLSERLSKGERVKPVTVEEKACYKLISDLDHVGGHVQGSLTTKRYM